MVSSRTGAMAHSFSCGYTIVVCGLSLSIFDGGLIPLSYYTEYGAATPQYCYAWGVGACSNLTQGSGGGAAFTWQVGNTSIINYNTPSDQYSSGPKFKGVAEGGTNASVNASENGCQSGGSGNPSPSTFTPSQHTYPNAPVTNCTIKTPFDGIINSVTKAIHKAQDLTSNPSTVGDPVVAPEAGTVTRIQGGQPHVNQPANQCAGQGYHANFIEITDTSGVTRLVHVTALAGITVGTKVTAGQQIGTIDISGCSSGPHTHMQRKQAGQVVNFDAGCNATHYDNPSTYYDDSDPTPF